MIINTLIVLALLAFVAYWWVYPARHF